METLITKSYQGVQTRLLLPKVKDVAGVIGDNNITRLCFKLPKPYNTGWTKYIEFDCYVYREGIGDVRPMYLLEEDDSFLVPYELTCANAGKEVDYNLRFVSLDGTITEKSELGTLYFRDTSDGTFVDLHPTIDIITQLVNDAYCSVEYSEDGETPTGVTVPKLTFTPSNPGGNVDSVLLNVPYLDENGHILTRFIDKEIVIEIFEISSPNALTTLEDAQIPDMALLSLADSSASYFMDLYMLVGNDPTDIDNWYLVHTDNPIYNNLQVNDLADIQNLEVSGSAIFNTLSADAITLNGASLAEKFLATDVNGTLVDAKLSFTTPNWTIIERDAPTATVDFPVNGGS